MLVVEAACMEKRADGEDEPTESWLLKKALPLTLRTEEMVDEPVTERAEVVAEVRETKPPFTALRIPPMVEEAVVKVEPVVVELPKALFPTALKKLPTVVEPKIETAPVVVTEKSVEVAVPRVEEEMMKANGLLIEVEAREIERVANGEVVPMPTLPEKVVVERREVEEAKIPLLAQKALVVAAATTPKLFSQVNAAAPAVVESVPQ